MALQFPVYRNRPLPTFLTARYGSTRTLFETAAHRLGTAAVDAVSMDELVRSLPNFQTLFDAPDADLIAALDRAVTGVEEPDKGLLLLKLGGMVKRLLIFEDLDKVAGIVRDKLKEVVAAFPRTLPELEDGKLRRSGAEAESDVEDETQAEDGTEPPDESEAAKEKVKGRDVLDPFIVALSSRLMTKSDLRDLLRHLLAHKCLMKLEDLIGHLHEEILGRAAGKERISEPEGVVIGNKRNKEQWHPEKNPFPGADARLQQEEFYQIKNKTGSAKGSDGEKLGRQFRTLGERYPQSKRYYVSLIGSTLAGHRSMGAFLRTDPDAEVLVGLAAFQQLGNHRDTPFVVLDLILDELEAVKTDLHYDFDAIVDGMVAEWKTKHGGGDPAHKLLYDTITSSPEQQQSTTYLARRENLRQAVKEARESRSNAKPRRRGSIEPKPS